MYRKDRVTCIADSHGYVIDVVTADVPRGLEVRGRRESQIPGRINREQGLIRTAQRIRKASVLGLSLGIRRIHIRHRRRVLRDTQQRVCSAAVGRDGGGFVGAFPRKHVYRPALKTRVVKTAKTAEMRSKRERRLLGS